MIKTVQNVSSTLKKSFFKAEAKIYQFRNYNTRLSPNEVTTILRSHENSEDINHGSIKSYDSNQLPSNSPIEDMRAEARCLLTTGMLFGVFDGHGGPACAQVVSKRLFNYISASLLPYNLLTSTQAQIKNQINSSPNSSTHDRNNIMLAPSQLLESYNDRYEMVPDLNSLYSSSFSRYLDELEGESERGFNMELELGRAFNALDTHLSKEAMERHGEINLVRKTLSVALSGAVAVVAHVDGEHLHVAGCGDCQAVLGVKSGENDESWVPELLTKEHNSENREEVERILGEHPASERDKIIVNERLLGQLAPLRAFGDYRFKWTNKEMRELIVPYLGEQGVLSQSLTPPYLTAKPEVFYHRLRPKDSFLILASDGLWDMMSPGQAVRLVGEHMSGKTVLSPYSLPQKSGDGLKLGILHSALLKRQEAFKVKPIDSNAATHLIRHALGGTDLGVDHSRLSYYLTLSEDTVRLYRDDITATVIYFDTDYLSSRPL